MANRKEQCTTYICDDCTLVFQVFVIPQSGRVKYCCPGCGDNVSVRRYRSEEKEKQEWKIIPWTEEELKIVEKVANGEMRGFQAAILIGRTRNAVAKQARKMKKQLAAN